MCFKSPKSGELLSCRTCAEEVFTDLELNSIHEYIQKQETIHGKLPPAFIARTKKILRDLFLGHVKLTDDMSQAERSRITMDDMMMDMQLGLSSKPVALQIIA